MGKQGPCYHCGVTNTPLWRNGPPEKPVLCNACGSRWRTKGTLANYTPLHARAEPDDFEDYRGSKVKTTPIRIKEAKVLKRKHIYDYPEVGVPTDYSQVLSKGLDEDTSNRSSSGSAVSNSESCAQFAGTELSDLTGPAQPNIWDTMVPSKKRTCVGRPKPSPVEKLTKDLCTILHEQQSSYFSGSSEEDLLFESDKPMVSVEIGHGSMLIRHPSSIGREEESEASSLSVDNKQNPVNEAYSPWPTPSVHIHNKVFNSPSVGTETIKKPTGHGIDQELVKRDKDRLEKLQMLGHHNSPLCYVDLKDIVNFDEFTSKLTTDEQRQLLKCLPSVDTSAPPDSFRGMFESAQFKENLSCFQKLLAEGVLDNSLSGVKIEDCRTLKRFAMCYLTKSKWVEQYNLLKDVKCKNSSNGFGVAGLPNDVGIGHSINVKRSLDGQNQKISATTIMKSPKRVASKDSYDENKENDGSLFSPKCLFALPPYSSSPALESSDDQDLLLDVPSNSSFPQAELLLPSQFDPQASTNSSSVFLK
ncbi:PREDICTED: GATA transcription factor 26-like isoform X3 [Ipomoea nil]|uniref:GATA transcription factor 26-like isoform X3 n=1 Tax=Ipomoea nil TaxID=35883 RepID=UPI000900B577|nr:PREDICTED: GATA transcription factor 26-like isoform X3 [Ipomoea nil]